MKCSLDYTQNKLYNLKQYDHYKVKILNDLLHITRLYTINNVLNKKLCMQITIHKKHKHTFKYKEQKSQGENFFQKCSEYYNT